jgi:hypothetical protein
MINNCAKSRSLGECATKRFEAKGLSISFKRCIACFVWLAWYKKGMEKKKATFLTNSMTFLKRVVVKCHLKWLQQQILERDFLMMDIPF